MVVKQKTKEFSYFSSKEKLDLPFSSAMMFTKRKQKASAKESTMYDTTHYAALMTRLNHEKQYLLDAKTGQEKELRTVWIAQIEKEIAQEVEFLKSKGISVYTESSDVDNLSDDDLLNELLGD